MTDEQIEQKLQEAKRKDGTYDGMKIIEMNKQGVYFSFTNEGVRWQREKFV